MAHEVFRHRQAPHLRAPPTNPATPASTRLLLLWVPPPTPADSQSTAEYWCSVR